MATHMPALGTGQHFSSVNYACTFGQITVAGGKVAFNAAVNFIFSFETGRTQPDPQLDLWDVSHDYSWFDQDAQEADIVTALDGNCAVIATLLSVTTIQVKEAVGIARVWTFALDVQGSAAPLQLGSAQPGGSTLAEVMPYAPVLGTGSAHGAGVVTTA